MTLSSSLANSYLWSNGETARDIVATTAGNYSVVVTNANGCSAASANTTVTVNTASWAGSDNTLEICASAVATSLFDLLPGATTGGSWSGPGGLAHGDFYDPTTDAQGVYTYAVSGPPGCGTDEAIVLVTEHATPNPGTLSGSTSHCGPVNSGSLALSGSTGTLQWQKRINGGSWINFSNAGSTYSYANLPVGNYAFRVIASEPTCPSLLGPP